MARSSNRHRVRVVSVHESSYGLEACITATLGDAEISFFDPYYSLTFHRYRPNVELDVYLAGIAYHVSVPEPGHTVHHREIGIISLDSAALLFPRKPLGAPAELNDGYGLAYIFEPGQSNCANFDFRGPVNSIQPVDFLARPASRIDMAITRVDDREINIDVYVLDERIPKAHIPQAGGDVQGVLWLQGTCWQHGSIAAVS